MGGAGCLCPKQSVSLAIRKQKEQAYSVGYLQLPKPTLLRHNEVDKGFMTPTQAMDRKKNIVMSRVEGASSGRNEKNRNRRFRIAGSSTGLGLFYYGKRVAGTSAIIYIYCPKRQADTISKS